MIETSFNSHIAVRLTLQNRIGDAMQHSKRYAFRPQARLSRDSRVSASSVSKILSGKSQPSYRSAVRLTAALERAFGISIDPRELVTVPGVPYPTASLCELVGCKGCSLTKRR